MGKILDSIKQAPHNKKKVFINKEYPDERYRNW